MSLAWIGSNASTITGISGLVGSAASGYSSYRSGVAQQEANEYNAKIAEANATQAKEKTAYEENLSRSNARQLIGKQMAMYAKSGVDITEGSPLLVMADTAAQAEKDALAIRWQGDVDYASYMNQANLLRFYGKQAKQSGIIGGATSLLQGIGQYGKSYMSGSKGYNSSPYWGTLAKKYSFLNE